MWRRVGASLLVLYWLPAARANDGRLKPTVPGAKAAVELQADPETETVYRELMGRLHKEGPRATSARLELESWHEHNHGIGSFLNSPDRHWIKTKDGESAEIVLIRQPACSMPGIDFSMAFLLVGDRVVDWASCLSHNRIARHEPRLEDVDGDGAVDLAFRAYSGFWGLSDERCHERPGDKRKWLYAYAITSTGFKSLFPETDKELHVTSSFDTVGQPVKLCVEGLPEQIREHRMLECTISATNTSNHDIAIEPGRWASVTFGSGGTAWSFTGKDKRAALKPGQTISHTLRFYLQGGGDLVWKFVPKSTAAGSRTPGGRDS